MKNPAQHPDGLDVKQMRGSRSGGLGIVLTWIGGAGLSERSGDPTVFWRAVHRLLRSSMTSYGIVDRLVESPVDQITLWIAKKILGKITKPK